MGVETILRASRLTATPAMTDDSQLSFNLPSVSRKKVTAAFDGDRLSSDSGVMLLALADRRRAVADTRVALIAVRGATVVSRAGHVALGGRWSRSLQEEPKAHE